MILQVNESIAKVGIGIFLIIYIALFVLSTKNIIKTILTSNSRYKTQAMVLSVFYLINRIFMTFSLVVVTTLIMTMPLQDSWVDTFKKFFETNDGKMFIISIICLVVVLTLNFVYKLIISNLLLQKNEEKIYKDFSNPFNENEEVITEEQKQKEKQEREKRLEETKTDFDTYLEKIREEKKIREENENKENKENDIQIEVETRQKDASQEEKVEETSETIKEENKEEVVDL